MATQEKALRQTLGGLPGGASIFTNVNGVHMEPPSEAQRNAIEQVSYHLCSASSGYIALRLMLLPAASILHSVAVDLDHLLWMVHLHESLQEDRSSALLVLTLDCSKAMQMCNQASHDLSRHCATGRPHWRGINA